MKPDAKTKNHENGSACCLLGKKLALMLVEVDHIEDGGEENWQNPSRQKRSYVTTSINFGVPFYSRGGGGGGGR